MDCSDKGFNHVPMPGAKQKNGLVRVLDLRRNNISSISERNVLELYHGLLVLDIRENPIDCGKVIFSKIKVKTNCKIKYTFPLIATPLYKYVSTQSCRRKTESVDIDYAATDIDTIALSECKSCDIKNSPTQLVPSVIKFEMNSPSDGNKQTKIILLTTLIPVIILVLLSVIIYGCPSLRCHQRWNEQNNANGNGIELNMNAIGSLTSIDTEESSIELYSTQF
jgi:hypothetical protein